MPYANSEHFQSKVEEESRSSFKLAALTTTDKDISVRAESLTAETEQQKQQTPIAAAFICRKL